MAAEIKREFGAESKFKKGHGGIFEVMVDGRVVHTNRDDLGVIPENEEVTQKIRESSG
ncbi:MAG: Rdx family protein [Armatimonadetes bacterium]|nr:Rdx family protein [Armatimonadota bacterium]